MRKKNKILSEFCIFEEEEKNSIPLDFFECIQNQSLLLLTKTYFWRQLFFQTPFEMTINDFISLDCILNSII